MPGPCRPYHGADPASRALGPVNTPHDVIGALLLYPSTWPVWESVQARSPFEKAISRGDRLCRRPPRHGPRQGRMLVVSRIMTRVRIWENIELSVGFRGCCERVTDHEAVLMDPKLFSTWVHRPVVLLKRGTGVWTADTQPVALLAKK
jgi:hypothetical protein